LVCTEPPPEPQAFYTSLRTALAASAALHDSLGNSVFAVSLGGMDAVTAAGADASTCPAFLIDADVDGFAAGVGS